MIEIFLFQIIKNINKYIKQYIINIIYLFKNNKKIKIILFFYYLKNNIKN